MAKTPTERLCADMELAIATGRRSDVVANVEALASQLERRWPGAGRSLLDIKLELIRMALRQDARTSFRQGLSCTPEIEGPRARPVP